MWSDGIMSMINRKQGKTGNSHIDPSSVSFIVKETGDKVEELGSKIGS